MARLTDHDQRDAEHALRAEITIILAKYARRMLSQGKAYITDAIAQSNKEGNEIDGTEIGRTAAARVRTEYFAAGSTEQAIDATATVLRIEGAAADRAAARVDREHGVI